MIKVLNFVPEDSTTIGWQVSIDNTAEYPYRLKLVGEDCKSRIGMIIDTADYMELTTVNGIQPYASSNIYSVQKTDDVSGDIYYVPILKSSSESNDRNIIFINFEPEIGNIITDIKLTNCKAIAYYIDGNEFSNSISMSLLAMDSSKASIVEILYGFNHGKSVTHKTIKVHTRYEKGLPAFEEFTDNLRVEEPNEIRIIDIPKVDLSNLSFHDVEYYTVHEPEVIEETVVDDTSCLITNICSTDVAEKTLDENDKTIQDMLPTKDIIIPNSIVVDIDENELPDGVLDLIKETTPQPEFNEVVVPIAKFDETESKDIGNIITPSDAEIIKQCSDILNTEPSRISVYSIDTENGMKPQTFVKVGELEAPLITSVEDLPVETLKAVNETIPNMLNTWMEELNDEESCNESEVCKPQNKLASRKSALRNRSIIKEKNEI